MKRRKYSWIVYLAVILSVIGVLASLMLVIAAFYKVLQ